MLDGIENGRGMTGGEAGRTEGTTSKRQAWVFGGGVWWR